MKGVAKVTHQNVSEVGKPSYTQQQAASQENALKVHVELSYIQC